MDGVSDLGSRIDFRNDYVLYLGVDRYIKARCLRTGYPQVNELVNADAMQTQWVDTVAVIIG
jgi:hypothetical protein